MLLPSSILITLVACCSGIPARYRRSALIASQIFATVMKRVSIGKLTRCCRGQSKYSDLAIETALRLRLLFQLRLAEARRVENTFMRYKGFRGDR